MPDDRDPLGLAEWLAEAPHAAPALEMAAAVTRAIREVQADGLPVPPEVAMMPAGLLAWGRLLRDTPVNGQ
jgi:hypothetical protein